MISISMAGLTQGANECSLDNIRKVKTISNSDILIIKEGEMTMATKSNGHRPSKLQKIYKRDKRKIINAAKSISSAANGAKEKFTDAEENLEKYAKSNPWKTKLFIRN